MTTHSLEYYFTVYIPLKSQLEKTRHTDVKKASNVGGHNNYITVT